jgi:hypothetical protein
MKANPTISQEAVPIQTNVTSHHGTAIRLLTFATRSIRFVPLLALALTVWTPALAEFEYVAEGGSITIIGYTGPGGDVAIPGTIEDQPVTGIADLAFWSCTNLTSVTIPGSVAAINRSAFEGCTSLTAIEVDPANLVYSSMDGVLLDKDEKTLIQCPTGKTGAYTIPNSVTTIAYSAFGSCGSLASVTIPDSVTEIGGWAFEGCTGLTNVEIPETVGRINASTFSDCASLIHVIIPSGIESIGFRAFAGCVSLKHIAIPDSVTSFDTNRIGGIEAFLGCTNLTAIEVNPLNPVYSSLDGVLLDKDRTTLVLYPGGKNGDYSVPGGVMSIGPMSFNDCAGLTALVVPDSVTTIGYGAFAGCVNLKSVIIAENVTGIGHWAFHDCANLKSIFCRGEAPTVGAGAFHGATNATVHFLAATTGWGTTFGERPTALWIPIIPTVPSLSEDYPLKVVSHSPAPANVRIQRSANLVDWEDWQTVSRDEGPSELQDTEAGASSYRFYRGIEQ